MTIFSITIMMTMMIFGASQNHQVATPTLKIGLLPQKETIVHLRNLTWNPQNEGLENVVPFQMGDIQVPFSGAIAVSFREGTPKMTQSMRK